MEYKHNKALLPNARNLRKNMTKEERRLWYEFLRDYPVKFRRQKILWHYIADFYCPEAQLVVEIDGSQHFMPENQEAERERTAFLESKGLKVLRIPNNYVNYRFPDACEYIHQAVMERRGTTQRGTPQSQIEDL